MINIRSPSWIHRTLSLPRQGLEHRPEADFCHFGFAAHNQGTNHGVGHLARLDQFTGLVIFTLQFMDLCLHRSGRATRKNSDDSNTLRIHFFAKTVCETFEGVLGGGILRYPCGSHEASGRIDKDNLAATFDQRGQKELSQSEWRADVALVEQIEITQRSVGYIGSDEHSRAVDKDIDTAEILRNLLFQRGEFCFVEQIDFVA